MILRPGGELIFQYKSLEQLGPIYTIGIQNDGRDQGLLISDYMDFAHSGLAIRIRPPGSESWLNLDPDSGTVPHGGVQAVAVTLSGVGLTPGDYYAELTVDSNAEGTPQTVVAVRFTIGNTPVELWRLVHFGVSSCEGAAADSAHHDGDLRNNLMDNAFDSDPLVTDTPSAPDVTTSAAGHLQIRFTRHAGRTDLRYLIEATSDLGGAWTSIARSIHGAPTVRVGARSCVETSAGELKVVIVEDVAPVTDFTTRYLRLRVVRD